MQLDTDIVGTHTGRDEQRGLPGMKTTPLRLALNLCTFHVNASWRLLLVAWMLLIAIGTTIPWTGFELAPQWERICWVPFQDFSLHSKVSLINVVGNCILFMPIGYLYVRSRSRSDVRVALTAFLLAVLVSLGVEFYQVFSIYRYPTATDVLANAIGGGVGAALAIAHEKSRKASFRPRVDLLSPLLRP